jgi:hypothetical protein
MRRRDLSRGLLGSAAGALVLTELAQAGAKSPRNAQRIRAEIDLQVVPADYSFPADPYIDPRRYGADPMGRTDSTAAMQTAINVANACRGTIWIGNDCSYLCAALSLTFTGDRNTSGLRIIGSSVNGSRLIQHGQPEAILTFRGAAPAKYPQESHLVLENFSIFCTGTHTDAIVLYGLGNWTIRNLHIGGSRHSIWLHFALTGLIEDCWLTGGLNGIYATAEGSFAGSNLVTVRNCVIDAHAGWGIDFDSGDRLKVEACDLEGNGTPGKLNTGALILRSNFGHATGYATADLDGVWFESNRGQVVSVEQNSRLTLAIRNTNWYSSENGNSLLVAGIAAVAIEDSNAPTATGDTWNITAQALFLKNVVVHTLIDTGVKLPTYSRVSTNQGAFGNGRSDDFVGKLTGVEGDAAKVNVSIRQQGDEIELSFSCPLPATKDAKGWEITGLPVRYRPKHDAIGIAVAQDRVLACRVAAATGVITIGRAPDFNNSAAMGNVTAQIRMRVL